jgi:hypothetical protein
MFKMFKIFLESSLLNIHFNESLRSKYSNIHFIMSMFKEHYLMFK